MSDQQWTPPGNDPLDTDGDPSEFDAPATRRFDPNEFAPPSAPPASPQTPGQALPPTQAAPPANQHLAHPPTQAAPPANQHLAHPPTQAAPPANQHLAHPPTQAAPPPGVAGQSYQAPPTQNLQQLPADTGQGWGQAYPGQGAANPQGAPPYEQQLQQQPGQYAAPPQQSGPWQQTPGVNYQPQQAGFDPLNPQPGSFGSSESVRSGGLRSKGGRLAIVATIALLAGFGGFAVWRSLSGTTGAATPDEAAASFFESLNNEDLLGVVEITLPSERESWLEPGTDVLVELSRLELLEGDVVDDNGEVSKIDGLQFDIPAPGEPGALVYESQAISGREDLQWVTVTSGTMDVTFNPQEFQDGIGGLFDDEIYLDEELETQTETVDFAELFLDGEPLEFAVVQQDGGYYLSVYYTIAGFAADKGDTILSPGPAPVGASSPEQAAVDFLTNAVELDGQGVLTLLDPNEFQVAYDYWSHYSPELLDSLTSAKQEAADEGVTWQVLSAQASAEERNGRTVASFDEVIVAVQSVQPGSEFDLVFTANTGGVTVVGTVEGAPFDFSINRTQMVGSGTIDGETFSFNLNLQTYEGFFEFGQDRATIRRDGDCLILTAPDTNETICDDDLGLQGAEGLLDFQSDIESAFEGAGRPGLTMVERDGRWYVTGAPTYLYTIVDYLKVLDVEEFNSLKNNYQDLVESGFDDMDF